MKLKGSTAVVTGGALRVGREIALRLAERGANVAIIYNRSAEAALKTVNEIEAHGVQARAVQCDVSRVDQTKDVINSLAAEFGSLDVLVNNAAIYEKTPLPALTEDEWDRHIDINLKGSFFCAKFAGEIMLRQQRGKIINFADWSGVRPYADYLPYCISKAGVIAMTRGLAKSLAPHVQVNCIAPGPILLPADFTEEEREAIIKATPLKRIGSPQDIAATVIFLVEGSDFITGTMITVDGGRLIA
ncbi:MAG: SDR family oxidoreductase [Acidobacteriia bacterium]|nr:SDR family oxidoreductase [Terriglobia bacterium]